MVWANFFHIYQPPNWDPRIIVKVATESYRPLLEILKRNPTAKITLNINACLTEQLAENELTDILADLQTLGKRGQIEFTGTAKYHTILPLLSEKEIARQITLNTEVNKKFLGDVYQPKGFFPPEMCSNFKVTEAVKTMGFEWIILDEISYNGTLGAVSFSRSHQLANGLKVIFRNRALSDYIAFSAPIDQPEEVVKTLQHDTRSTDFIVTAMDGENLGHHRIGTDVLWEQIIGRFPTITMSELLEKRQTVEELNLLPGSWSSQPEDLKRGAPYRLWHDHENEIHMLQWTLTHHITRLVDQAEEANDQNISEARQRLDAALASDQYWWASAEPWWSREIVIRETREMVNVIKNLKTISNGDRRHAEDLYGMIVRETDRWNTEGIAKKRAAAYQQRINRPHYLGGKQVI